MPSIIISQYLYDIHFLKKDIMDVKMNNKETVKIVFNLIDCLHNRTLEENDYKIRYSAILSTGVVSPPKKTTIKINTTIHNMINELVLCPPDMDFNEYQIKTKDYYIKCTCKDCEEYNMRMSKCVKRSK